MMFLIFHRCHFYIMVKIFNYGGGTFSLPEPNNLIYRLKALEFTQLHIQPILLLFHIIHVRVHTVTQI